MQNMAERARLASFTFCRMLAVYGRNKSHTRIACQGQLYNGQAPVHHNCRALRTSCFLKQNESDSSDDKDKNPSREPSPGTVKEGPKKGATPQRSATSPSSQMKHRFSKIVPIPQNEHPDVRFRTHLLGNRGAALHEVQLKTQTSIRVEQTPDEGGKQQLSSIRIRGPTQESVRLASEQMDELIWKCIESEKATISKSVPIPQEQHPNVNFNLHLLGNRGAALIDIFRKTGASITAKKVRSADGKYQIASLSIQGQTEESVQQANKQVDELIKKCIENSQTVFSESVPIPQKDHPNVKFHFHLLNNRAVALREVQLKTGVSMKVENVPTTDGKYKGSTVNIAGYTEESVQQAKQQIDELIKEIIKSSKSGPVQETSRKTPGNQSKQSKKRAVLSTGVEPELVTAAKAAAASLPGDSESASADLLQKLQEQATLTKQQKQAPTLPPADAQTSDTSNAEVEPELVAPEAESAPPVADGSSTATADLLTELKAPSSITDSSAPVDDPLSAQSKQQSRLDRETAAGKESQDRDEVNREADKTQSRSTPQSFRLFDGYGLGIFKKEKMKQSVSEETLWDQVEREELISYQMMKPDNGFEEQINWTLQGKMWQFPINNEAGWDEEAKVGFHEHVFLESQLQDFPDKGPIRHFMELVTVALSNNPYLTVRQKHEHIDWFRDYFLQKQDVLEENLDKKHLMKAFS